MSADQIKILEAALDLIGVIAIFAFSVLLAESLDTKQDLKDDKEITPRADKEITPRAEPPEPQKRSDEEK